MHAQTISTAAPAKEIVSGRAHAALSAAIAPQTLAEAITAGLGHLNGPYAAAEKAHSAAENEVAAARRALSAIPVPACLVVRSNRRYMTKVEMTYSDGSTEVSEPREIQSFDELSSSADILAHVGGDVAAAEPLLAALAGYDGARAPLLTRLDEAERAERATDEVWQAALRRSQELAEDVLDAPAATSAEVAAKVDAYARISGLRHGYTEAANLQFHEDTTDVLNAVMDDLKRFEGPPPPASDAALIAAIDEVAALDVAMIATADMEEAGRLSGAKQAPIDLALTTRATSLAGLQSRVRLVEMWAPKADTLDGQDLEWMIVRSLLDDIRGLDALPSSQTFSLLTGLVAKRAELIAQINAMADEDPSADEAKFEEACAPLWKQISRIERKVWDAPCQSVADAAAMAEFVRHHDLEGSQVFAEPLQTMMVKIAAALNRERPTSPVAALLPELDRRWAIEIQADRLAETSDAPQGLTDDQLTAVCDYTGAVAHRIIATPAQSLADFQAKARAVLWCIGDHPDDWEAEGTINRFAKSLVLELLGHAPTPVDEAKLAEWGAAGEALLAQGGVQYVPHAIAAE